MSVKKKGHLGMGGKKKKKRREKGRKGEKNTCTWVEANAGH